MAGADEFRVQTPRLILRPFDPGDITDLVRIGRDPRVAPMMGSIPLDWSDDAARNWVARWPYRGTVGFRVALQHRDGPLIGAAGLVGAPVSLNYFLDPAMWGQGLATEAARGLLAGAFARFSGLDIVVADHFADNPASGRVLEKLGFVRMGTGAGRSLARLEPAPKIQYRLMRRTFEASHEIS
ncbi:50S ribosomal protein acetyltransferase [Rhodovulum sp. P5]|uniref:GNAT family N-acetyltransferase n=1 Tax=Rhodovulum sp. P5 TaxID=1564506 RepID=UPI0009C244BB|nr:GNAT family N-acetyltransferase [Rhodovulum sp. P5]ARE39155.1 50S ribosomal protein acetyltransferase [Rhodovulum sp. P5]